jgi:hypothetical protein
MGLVKHHDSTYGFDGPVILPYRVADHGIFLGWVSEKDVLDELGPVAMLPEDNRKLTHAVRAVNWAIMQWRPDLLVPFQGGLGPFDGHFSSAFKRSPAEVINLNPRISLGATELARRWYVRFGGEQLQSFGEFGGPMPIVDKDIEQLLEINRAFRSCIA